MCEVETFCDQEVDVTVIVPEDHLLPETESTDDDIEVASLGTFADDNTSIGEAVDLSVNNDFKTDEISNNETIKRENTIEHVSYENKTEKTYMSFENKNEEKRKWLTTTKQFDLEMSTSTTPTKRKIR